jgi:hypothetical protein
MSVLDRLFGKGRTANAAEKAELRGDLGRAVELWVEAGHPSQAARVMVLRGDAEVEPARRMQFYIQAATLAPATHAVQREARLKRALLTIALAGGHALSRAARDDVLAAAADLEALHEPERAAEAYGLAGDREGEARALAQAGDIEKLEDLLVSEGDKERAMRTRHHGHAEIDVLAASGRRREALEAAVALAQMQPGAADDRAHGLRTRALKGPLVRLLIEGKAVTLILGDEVVIGRTEGSLRIASHAVSRVHLRIARADGRVRVSDLGSRNGTQLRGMNVKGALDVGDDLALQLGKEVPIRLAPALEIPGALAIDVAGDRYLAPLGPARLSVAGWVIELASDGWVELLSANGSAFIKGVSLVTRATLLVGDAISASRTGEVVLRVV